jgi:hypothetical protein
MLATFNVNIPRGRMNWRTIRARSMAHAVEIAERRFHADWLYIKAGPVVHYRDPLKALHMAR